jgi:hypothetical protein
MKVWLNACICYQDRLFFNGEKQSVWCMVLVGRDGKISHIRDILLHKPTVNPAHNTTTKFILNVDNIRKSVCWKISRFIVYSTVYAYHIYAWSPQTQTKLNQEFAFAFHSSPFSIDVINYRWYGNMCVCNQNIILGYPRKLEHSKYFCIELNYQS